MTVSATNAFSGPYTGNGTATAFAFTFKAEDASEVSLEVNGAPVAATIVLAGEGGTATAATAPASGAVVYVRSRPSFQQNISLTDNGAFLPKVIEEGLDRGVIRDIALKAVTDRALLVPGGGASAEFNPVTYSQFIGPSGTMSLSGIAFTTPQQFGAVADNATDCLAAFQAAIAYLKTKDVGSGFYRGAPRLYIPCGQYYLSDTLEIKGVTFIMEGEGSGQAGGNATVLRWPANKCGIRVQRYNTLGAGLESVPTQGSDGLIIRNLMLQGSGGTATDDSSGIWARCRIRVQDVCVDGFAGSGILFRATQGSGTAAQEGNANCWRVDTVRLTNNKKSGLRLIGADVNAGLSTMVDGSNNLEWGINDGSFLGNRHIGHHMEANGLGPWTATDGNAFCHFAGYTEPGQPNAVASPNTTWEGNQFVPVTGNGGSGLRANGLDGGGYGSSNGFYVNRSADGVHFLKHIMGCDPANSEFDNFFTAGGMKFGISSLSNDDWGITAESVNIALRVKNGSTLETFGRATNATTKGALQLDRGVWIGAGSAARLLNLVQATDLASAITALTGNEVARGDKWVFNQPSPAGKEGVICTTSGTVGTTAVLKAFGSVDP